MFDELQIVRLKLDLLLLGICRGAVGTLLMARRSARLWSTLARGGEKPLRALKACILLVPLTCCAQASAGRLGGYEIAVGSPEVIPEFPLAVGALDGSCRVYSPPGRTEAPSEFALRQRSVWPWTAADLDCIYHFYSARSLSDFASKGDRTAQFAVALSNGELAISPCQSPVRKTIELYAKEDEEKYAYRISEVRKSLPDAAYTAGSIARYCGDKESAAVFFSKRGAPA